MIDRAFTKAEAPIHPEWRRQHGQHGASDAHRRCRCVLVPAVPVRCRYARHDHRAVGLLRSARLRAGRAGSRHNINMRATFLAGGKASSRNCPRCAQHRPRADHRVPPRRAGAAAEPGCGPTRHAEGRQLAHAGAAHRPQRLPRPTRADDLHHRRTGHPRRRSVTLATMFDEEAARCPAAPLLAGGDNVGASPPNSRCSRTRPRSTWRTRGVSTPRRTATTSSTTASRGSSTPGSGRLPVPATNIVDEDTGESPDWVRAVTWSESTDQGRPDRRRLESPPSSSAGATAGLTFLAAVDTHPARSRSAPPAGRQDPGGADPRGHGVRRQPIAAPPPFRGTGRSSTSRRLQDTTVDVIIAGHTHRVSNLMVGDILVTEGINAGASYSVVQMVVQGRDVEWAGGATRIAKNIGVAKDRRAGDRRRRQRADRAAAEPGDRHQATDILRDLIAAVRVGDGQHGRGRDAD